eukprot:7710-Chlamydomonas_euryale.AAC.3
MAGGVGGRGHKRGRAHARHATRRQRDLRRPPQQGTVQHSTACDPAKPQWYRTVRRVTRVLPPLCRMVPHSTACDMSATSSQDVQYHAIWRANHSPKNKHRVQYTAQCTAAAPLLLFGGKHSLPAFHAARAAGMMLPAQFSLSPAVTGPALTGPNWT